ncbi:2-methylcitrate dehydratase [Xylariales sp. AK1849]|nr:2-methylcitrate dehydratase [Xylariales sp. AK1849]
MTQTDPSHNDVKKANGEVSGQGITSSLCRFVAEAKYEMLNETHVAKLKDLVVDLIGISAGAAAVAESSESFLESVLALHGNNGECTVFTKGKSFSPQYAGLLNAAYAHTFDFDDTHATSILHPGATAIPAALAQAELSKCDGKTFLLGVAVGYEITTRIGRGLNYGGYDRGFHNTATAGIFGAVAAISKIKGLSAPQIENAFGLALSKASGSMQFLDNGSWNKRLHPGFAVHDAFVVVALAEAGVLGATRPIEGKYGVLHSYSTTSTDKGIIDGLGSEWIFSSTAMKPFPSCRMTHSAIEVVSNVAQESKDMSIDRITVELSPGCFPIVGTLDPNKLQPKTIVDAQFSIYYQVAVAWLYGMNIGWKMYEKLGDQEVSAWCEKVKAITTEGVRDLEARVTFDFTDGTTRKEAIVYPLGEDEHPLSKDSVHSKFLGMTEPCYDSNTQRAILDIVENIDSHEVTDLLQLL